MPFPSAIQPRTAQDLALTAIPPTSAPNPAHRQPAPVPALGLPTPRALPLPYALPMHARTSITARRPNHPRGGSSSIPISLTQLCAAAPTHARPAGVLPPHSPALSIPTHRAADRLPARGADTGRAASPRHPCGACGGVGDRRLARASGAPPRPPARGLRPCGRPPGMSSTQHQCQEMEGGIHSFKACTAGGAEDNISKMFIQPMRKPYIVCTAGLTRMCNQNILRSLDHDEQGVKTFSSLNLSNKILLNSVKDDGRD
ncbi:hypothetical protein U9M48_036525 [Paspalum notatum var. saurae]|uniref:Uncharacterized protein n=1 Tax=Paspalum notatum var. saurae TaxID=547442 RepID=A0AAQ3UHD0_PASNO